jgi:2-polyprenyl-6-methoxyphenol hydroxylase-like FAD-dependent oxidoreductase
LIGNAAHTFPPLAALSFNLAIYEVAHLAALLTSKQPIILSPEILHQFSQHTYQQVANSIRFSHHLALMNAKPHALLNQMVALGLNGLDFLTPVKKYLLKKLLGQLGPLPPLLYKGLCKKNILNYT